MKYKGHVIIRECDHVVVVASDGTEWTEDSIEDAKKQIDTVTELWHESEKEAYNG